MSMEYCEDCDKMIDLDYDLEHECFEMDEKTFLKIELAHHHLHKVRDVSAEINEKIDKMIGDKLT